jgi:hypothetical protein
MAFLIKKLPKGLVDSGKSHTFASAFGGMLK